MSFDVLNTPCYMGTDGPDPSILPKMLKATLPLPGVTGFSGGAPIYDWAAGDFSALDPLLACLLPGQRFRYSGFACPAPEDAPFETVTVQASFQNNPPKPRIVPVIWDPLFIAYYTTAHQALLDHLDEIDMLDRLDGLGLGGPIGWGAEAKGFWAKDELATWSAVAAIDTIPDLAVGAYTQLAAAISSMLPGKLLAMSIDDPGTFSPGGAKDDGAFAKRVVDAQKAAAGGLVTYVDESVEADGVPRPLYVAVNGGVCPAIQPHDGVLCTALPAGCPYWFPLVRTVVEAVAA